MIATQPYIWFQLRDASNTLATQRYHIHHGAEAAAGLAAATTMRGRLSGCSSCAIIEQRYVLPFVELFPNDPQAASDVRRCGVFVFSTAEPDQWFVLAVPGIRDELLTVDGVAPGVLINQDAPEVAALVEEMTSGRYCNPFGHIITQLEAAYLQVRDAVFVPIWLQ